ncbi:hypothetical protein [Brevundimonas sp. 357]|uniref:DUF3885 domain-containing protein n=1 Tax=Brevundimonas sp. 357 TaxID=2555782 RepID=UPI000F782786|nr:hypothetical protein [Brevundimonas sp. 357]
MSFENAWTKYHAGQRPVGWMLREGGAKNWLRFHSLPASKRYADTNGERAILLARQNALAEEVLGADPCWLVQTHWTTHANESDAADQYDPFRATRELGLDFVSTFLVDDDEEDRPWRVYATQTNWSPGRFDDLLLAVADEKAGPTLWMAANGAIFAPYDGGVDLFLPDVAQVQRMAERHKDWLSPHLLGL